MKVLGDLTQFKLTAFITTFLRDHKNFIWFANMSDGVLFVNKTTPVKMMYCYRATYTRGVWIVQDMWLDNVDLEWVGWTDHEPAYFHKSDANVCMRYSGRSGKWIKT